MGTTLIINHLKVRRLWPKKSYFCLKFFFTKTLEICVADPDMFFTDLGFILQSESQIRIQVKKTFVQRPFKKIGGKLLCLLKSRYLFY